MKKIIYNEKYIVCNDFDVEKIKKKLNDEQDVQIVCFEDTISNEKYYLELLNEEYVNKIILFGEKPKVCFGEKLIVTNKLKKKFFKKNSKIIFIINTDIDEEILIPLVQLFDIAKENNIEIGIKNLLGFSKKVNDELIIALMALLQENLYNRYEIIYDYLCLELDKKFADNSICKFEGNKCIANRKHYNRDKVMGCCYSFNYNGLQFTDVKLCQHQNNHRCNVKCLGCKLFTCEYLKKHGIRFSLDNMPVALAFFNKKQREVLRTTFFVDKNVVLNKVEKINKKQAK